MQLYSWSLSLPEYTYIEQLRFRLVWWMLSVLHDWFLGLISAHGLSVPHFCPFHRPKSSSSRRLQSKRVLSTLSIKECSRCTFLLVVGHHFSPPRCDGFYYYWLRDSVFSVLVTHRSNQVDILCHNYVPFLPAVDLCLSFLCSSYIYNFFDCFLFIPYWSDTRLVMPQEAHFSSVLDKCARRLVGLVLVSFCCHLLLTEPYLRDCTQVLMLDFLRLENVKNLYMSFP